MIGKISVGLTPHYSTVASCYNQLMHWVYVLLGKEQRLYFGQTNNLRKRLLDHNEGKSVATKPYRPWKIVYLEGYASRLDALDREKKLKQFGQSYARLKKRIGHCLQDG